MNRSLYSLVVALSLHSSPNQPFSIIKNIRISHSYSSFIRFSKLQKIHVYNSQFSHFLYSVLVFKNSLSIDCGQKLNPAPAIVENCRFCDVDSTGNGGACYFGTSSANIVLNSCSFVECKSSGTGGAVFVHSSCSSFSSTKCCYSRCTASSSHSFRVECSNIDCTDFGVFQCSYSITGTVGSFCITKPAYFTRLNSTSNYLNGHGACFHLYSAQQCTLTFSNIMKNKGMAIQMVYGTTGSFSYQNIVGNAHTRDTVLYSGTGTNWNNCYISGNNTPLTNGSPIFTDCSLDVNQYSGPTWNGVNYFAGNTQTQHNLVLFRDDTCKKDEFLATKNREKMNRVLITVMAIICE